MGGSGTGNSGSANGGAASQLDGGVTSDGGPLGEGGTPAGGSGGLPNLQGACLSAGSLCTYSNAEDCCSGACDGDSCCGFLGDACPNGHGCCSGSCIAGTCQCPPGTLDCGNGCTDIEYNENACGDCDTQCGVNSLCEDRECICDPNLFDAQFYEICPDGCFNTRSDDAHCGDCETVCMNGTECTGNGCECPFGTEDCGNGCEDLSQNDDHCGSCPNACDTATEQCVNYQCVCQAGLSPCPGVGCVDLQSDDNNCQTCGNICGGQKTCQSGMCAN
jgi:hypothetical protein